MKIKTSELTGKALDFSVAKAVGMDIYMCSRSHDDEYGWIGNYEVTAHSFETPVITFGLCKNLCIEFNGDSTRYSPSTDWSQCGHLMDRYCKSFGMVQRRTNETWRAFAYGAPWNGQDTMRLASGDTLQIAFCRALVTAQLGDEVEIPSELMEKNNDQ
ncbi:DUF2591 family protein [Xenorhabdus sp. PB61.4]|uniref:phage protein NinX family protein n=1 Tax=Xenorhabdus sp. PB61.4 TaxID=2788940 RepID=UPI001E2BE280|nr:DUF2591 family protein [Xenorhabdus sp. PB61.4]